VPNPNARASKLPADGGEQRHPRNGLIRDDVDHRLALR